MWGNFNYLLLLIFFALLVPVVLYSTQARTETTEQPPPRTDLGQQLQRLLQRVRALIQR